MQVLDVGFQRGNAGLQALGIAVLATARGFLSQNMFVCCFFPSASGAPRNTVFKGNAMKRKGRNEKKASHIHIADMVCS